MATVRKIANWNPSLTWRLPAKVNTWPLLEKLQTEILLWPKDYWYWLSHRFKFAEFRQQGWVISVILQPWHIVWICLKPHIETFLVLLSLASPRLHKNGLQQNSSDTICSQEKPFPAKAGVRSWYLWTSFFVISCAQKHLPISWF